MPSGDFKSDKVEMENVFITSLFWFRKGASRNLVGKSGLIFLIWPPEPYLSVDGAEMEIYTFTDN